MCLVIFLIGCYYYVLLDRLDYQVVKILQVFSVMCFCIGCGQYLMLSEYNLVGLLEEVLLEVMVVDFIYQWICKELGKNLLFICLDELVYNVLVKGLISQDEVVIFICVEYSCLCSINVDDFVLEELVIKLVKLLEKVCKVEVV